MSTSSLDEVGSIASGKPPPLHANRDGDAAKKLQRRQRILEHGASLPDGGVGVDEGEG
eukprot:CAMPEP_0174708144 /NCGR_PEP_ID=MMETSP1094-20130205/10477_1 /TAXON_ID=156173 /ORGANISM="Chrysochromulina brevifilum, Strain UTEX LB 985" /LENGTH=57 /DNA_ID=CAMNT_0015906653 /DNA_START=626 /DNA_END=797 /DNA_ORIENTATION=-